MKQVWISCASFVLLAAAAMGQDFDKSKHPWLKYKAGTSVTFKITYEIGEMKQEGTMTQTLAEVREKDYVTKLKYDVMGQEQEREEVEEYPVKGGTETLKIDGKDVKCTIWVTKGKRGDNGSESRMWIPEGSEVPVKVTFKVENEEDGELVAVKMNEEITVGGKKYTCVKLEGKLNAQMGELKAVAYACGDVPGGLVKMTANGDVQGNKLTITNEVTQVDIKE